MLRHVDAVRLVYWLSPAVDTAESRLGRGRNPPARLRCCSDCCAAGDGASALRAQCPLPMGTSRASAPPVLFEVDGGEGGEAGLVLLPAGAACLRSLWRLQRKEPGWFVGEHMQEDRRLLVEDGDETLTDLPGERAGRLTRVGEAER